MVTSTGNKLAKKMDRVGLDDRIVDIISYVGVVGFAIMCTFPFLYVISMSFTSYADYQLIRKLETLMNRYISRDDFFLSPPKT